MIKRLLLAVAVLCVWAAQAGAVISFVGSGHTAVNNGSTSITVTYPAGVQTNDLIIVYITTFNTTTTAPGGWTQLGTAQANNGPDDLMVFYQIYTSGASQAFGSTLAFPTAQIRVYRGVNTSTPIDQYVIGASTNISLTSLPLPVDSTANTTGQHTTWPAGTANNNEWAVFGWSNTDTTQGIVLNGALGNQLVANTGDTYGTGSGDETIASSGTTPATLSATYGTAQRWLGFATTLVPATAALSGVQIGFAR